MRKRLLVWAFLALTAILSGCTDMFRTELDETNAKLKALQELAASTNKELTALSEIVSKLDDTHTIDPKSLVMTDEGYEVSFRDGTKIFIPFGRDGIDGRTLIPVGVKQAEDGLYYWTVDGTELKDAEGNKIRAAATDGKDGIVPQVKVEDGLWKLSVDNGETFTTIASCEEMDGVGVFSGIDLSDPTKAVLTLINGTKLEIPCITAFKLSFDGPAQDTLLIGGGETLPIPYSLTIEGQAGEPIVVTSGTDGTYVSRVEAGPSPESGTVYVQAPEAFSDGYILLTANCGGYSAVKMISFQPRQVSPARDTVIIRMPRGGFTRVFDYSTNFDYTVETQNVNWMKAVSSPSEKTLSFTTTDNTGNSVRNCTVKVSPKDNPDYACTVFLFYQATNSLTFGTDSECPFSYNDKEKTLVIPTEGGEGDLWITYSSDLSVTGLEDTDWATAEISRKDGFYQLRIKAAANDSGESREAKFKVQVGQGDNIITLREFTLIQR